MSNKSMASSSCKLLPMMLLLLLLLLPAMPDAAAAATAKRRARISATSSSINSNNNESLTEPKQAAQTSSKTTAAEGKLKTSADSKYEIRGVAGEPNYKSVNLTWEVEFVTSAHDTDTNSNGPNGNANANAVTNMSDDVEPPKAFQIFYCEMQNYGPQRCRVKLVNGSIAELPSLDADTHQVQHFAAAVDNLRMATRYSFHIRPVQPRRLRSSSARADFHDENEIESGGATAAASHLPGQSIIIPTKGFSAHATQCLAHASEIEVETGPYFGGRIVVDGGDCGIKGNANDPADKYTMRIDHKLCGSMVKPETNTVETFITVQENLGIFTHSTRRFVVVCSYQSGIQTVRASFTVPGKNSGVAAAVEQNDPFQPDDERLGRELRQMRYVNKSELVLKEPAYESIEQPAVVMETKAPELDEGQGQLEEESQQSTDEEEEEEEVDETEQLAQKPQQKPLTANRQQGQRALSLSRLNELNNLASALDVEAADEAPAQGRLLEQLGTKYAKLVVDQGPGGHGYNGASWTSARAKADANDDEFYAASLRYISANLGSVLVTVSISVIIISICIVLLQRRSSSSSSCNKRQSHLASHGCPAAHLPHKTLPRALQQQQYQCTL
ncbi:uncharacterized protein LOC117565774 [Drosophila albomicans]|uniref:Uncharacterized protein LOC117565774 n=1 Tax=Drosophila albomicans TaxID=7291 RepID=A0A6P8WB89_DROAB|nr:uncharacterized protein LOC117565774 [Drosophila albomicans]